MDPPLTPNAHGLAAIPMTFSGAEHACDVRAELADSLGLVCYDP